MINQRQVVLVVLLVSMSPSGISCLYGKKCLHRMVNKLASPICTNCPQSQRRLNQAAPTIVNNIHVNRYPGEVEANYASFHGDRHHGKGYDLNNVVDGIENGLVSKAHGLKQDFKQGLRSKEAAAAALLNSRINRDGSSSHGGRYNAGHESAHNLGYIAEEAGLGLIEDALDGASRIGHNLNKAKHDLSDAALHVGQNGLDHVIHGAQKAYEYGSHASHGLNGYGHHLKDKYLTSQHGSQHDHGYENTMNYEGKHNGGQHSGGQHQENYGHQYDIHHGGQHGGQHGAQYGRQHEGQHGGQHGGKYSGQYGGQHGVKHGAQYGRQHDGQYGGKHGGKHGGQYGGQHDSQYGGHYDGHQKVQHGDKFNFAHLQGGGGGHGGNNQDLSVRSGPHHGGHSQSHGHGQEYKHHDGNKHHQYGQKGNAAAEYLEPDHRDEIFVHELSYKEKLHSHYDNDDYDHRKRHHGNDMHHQDYQQQAGRPSRLISALNKFQRNGCNGGHGTCRSGGTKKLIGNLINNYAQRHLDPAVAHTNGAGRYSGRTLDKVIKTLNKHT